MDSAQFRAGAALAAVDAVVRSGAPWTGVWHQRLALAAAAATCKHLGRTETAQELRDLWTHRAGSSELGPAGQILAAWREQNQEGGLQHEHLARAAALFGLPKGMAVAELAGALQAITAAALPAAAEGAARVMAAAGEDRGCEVLGLWVADAMLSRALRWPMTVPLFVPQMLARSGKRHPRPGEPEWLGAAAAGVAAGAVSAVAMAGDVARRAEKLVSVAAKVRTKQVGAVVEMLLREEAITAAAVRARMSDRAARRVCERLTALGGIRELSGRATFRIYGL